MAAGFSLTTTRSVMDEINLITLITADQRFVFVFTDATKDETLRHLARFAANPDIPFSWFDAALLSRKIRDGKYEDKIGTQLLWQR